jgi:hypothetical protein
MSLINPWFATVMLVNMQSKALLIAASAKLQSAHIMFRWHQMQNQILRPQYNTIYHSQ